MRSLGSRSIGLLMALFIAAAMVGAAADHASDRPSAPAAQADCASERGMGLRECAVEGTSARTPGSRTAGTTAARSTAAVAIHSAPGKAGRADW
jgi:hypothetical protein